MILRQIYDAGYCVLGYDVYGSKKYWCHKGKMHIAHVPAESITLWPNTEVPVCPLDVVKTYARYAENGHKKAPLVEGGAVGGEQSTIEETVKGGLSE